MKELILAESAGFCFGVRRSVEMAEKLLASGQKAASLGELIHNAQVVQTMAEHGLRVIRETDEAQPDETVMIRAHGVGPSVLRRLKEAGISVVDATCPKVKAIH